jgi:hypothetical protein
MSCKCLDEIDQKLDDAEANTKISRAFWALDGGVSMTASIETEVVEKKRGARPMRLKPSHCPFCGVKYGKAEG